MSIPKLTIVSSVVLVGTVLLLFWIWSLNQRTLTSLEESAASVQHTLEVKSAISRLQTNLSEASNGARGFLIYDEPRFENASLTAVEQAKRSFEKLQQLARNNPQQVANLAELRPHLEKRLEFIRSLIKARQEGSADTARKLFIDGVSDHNYPLVRELLDRIDGVEDELLAERRQLKSLRTEEGQKMISILSLAIFLVAAFSFWAIVRYSKLNQQAVSALRTAETNAVRASEAKSAFIANLSHEIRTPMTAILGYTDMLLEPSLSTADRINYIQNIRRNGDHLLRIINDILDISKIEANKLDVESTETDLKRLMAELASIVRQRAVEKKLSLNVNAATPLPQTIKTDGLRLRQVLINLLGNACKFTHSGSVSLIAEVENGRLKFHIHDTGVGMSPEEISQLFHPFSQADVSTARRFGGTGLGLAISKRLTELLGGTLTVRSTKGAGSTFTLSLPFQQIGSEMFDNAAMSHASTEVSREGFVRRDTKHTGSVLLVEDSPDNQNIVSYHLRKMGASVDIEVDGEAGVQRALSALARGAPYSLILMDMQLPKMDGYSAVAMLREMGYTRPIVAITANVLEADRARCITAGCNQFIGKPLNLDQFYEVVSQFLASARQPEFIAGSGVPERLKNDPEFREMQRAFLDALPDRARELKDAVASNNHDALKKIAHQLAGSSASYGLSQLSSVAFTLEQALINNGDNLSKLAHHIRELEDQLGKGMHGPARTI